MRRHPFSEQLSSSLMLIVTLVSLAPLIGCGSDDCPCCDLPRAVHDWIIEIDPAPIPDPITEYPIYIGVGIEVRSLENGALASDGLTVTLTVSPGSFIGGESAIERSLMDGRTSATIQADAPGSYRLAVTVEDAGRTAWVTIEVGR